MTEFTHCENELKNNDYPRYICCLFTPTHLRKRLFALYAFNHEVAKIKDITSEQMTGLIRLTWWMETINEIYSGSKVRNHEVAKALSEVIRETALPREYLEHIISAREADLGLKQIMNMDELYKYIDDTSGNLLKASLHVLGAAGEKTSEVVQNISRAYAIIGIMRNMRHDASKMRTLIPHDMLEKNFIHLSDLSEGKHLERMEPIINELCKQASNNLKAAAKLRKSLPKEAMPIYLHKAVAAYFLKLIRKNNYDLFHSNLESGKFGLLFRIAIAARFG